MPPQKRAVITNGATGSPIECDEEREIIETYLVEDERDESDFAD
jgi:hypothetical protein